MVSFPTRPGLRPLHTSVDGGQPKKSHAGTGAKLVSAFDPTFKGAPVTKASSVGGQNVLGIRATKGGLGRLWNSVRALAGNGDPKALERASKVVDAVRAKEATLENLDNHQLRARFETAAAQVKTSVEPLRIKADELDKAAKKAKFAGQDATTLEQEANKARAEFLSAEKAALQSVLTDVLAVSGEVCARTLNMRPYDVQLLAGALLSDGDRIVEQYTGEGKTLTAVGSAALAATTGRGVHVTTATNFLALRDAQEMAPAYNALGMSVAALTPNGAILIDAHGEQRHVSRALAYKADVLYATATEIGFDYLRDNLVTDPRDRVQQGHATLIMDEVDSLLIDDARTPLVISGKPVEPDQAAWANVMNAVNALPEDCFDFDRSEGWVALKEEGWTQLSLALDAPNLGTSEDPELLRMVQNAAKARILFIKDRDYMVSDDNKVLLVGKNGEVLPGRRFADGLHQAIEAKEGVEILPETRSQASMTMRELLGLYDHRAGMTGTAESSEDAFVDVYGLDPVSVPTRKELQRTDHETRLFNTIAEKAMALMEDALAASENGQPVWIGTPDVRTAEALSYELSVAGIEHNLITGKPGVEAEEAEIIRQGGVPGAITIVTPKGGRGVHVPLGGDKRAIAEQLMEGGIPEKRATRLAKKQVSRVAADIESKGGLLVLGFSHHDSKRRDDQLRGRCARQGEVGTTRFYASLEDEFFKHDDLPNWTKNGLPAEGLSGSRVQKLIKKHLKLSEGQLSGSLSESLPFDDVCANHRQRFLEQRAHVFASQDLKSDVKGMVLDHVATQIDSLIGRTKKNRPLKRDALMKLSKAFGGFVSHEERKGWARSTPAKIKRQVLAGLSKQLETQVARTDDTTLRTTVLSALVESSSAHLTALNQLKQGINWTALAQQDPKIQYSLRAAEQWTLTMAATRGQLMETILAW